MTRDRIAERLGHSSGNYLGRRVKLLCQCTVGDLMTMPVLDALEIVAGPTIQAQN